jgi:CelD/BcsL family acetyltransferase involved in cellulose biosynthesis
LEVCSINIIEIKSYTKFLSLKEQWDAVLQKTNHSIFATWDWLSIYWKYFGAGKRLLVLVAEDNGKIIGIAPLMYSIHKMFGLRNAKIEFIGAKESDYNDFILLEKEDECIDLFVKYLNTLPLPWDCIDLTDIPENSKALPCLNGLAKNLKSQHICPYIQLPNSNTEFLNSIKGHQRKDLRRIRRRLEEKYNVEFTCYSGECSIDDEMTSFFDLHQKRWESQGLPGVFSSSAIRNFHIEIAKKFFEKGWLGLYNLNVSGTPVASLYGFKYRSKYYGYLSGFDPKYFRFNVGSLLFLHAIEDCIRQGLAEFDFLRGTEEYKTRWNTKVRLNHQATLIRNGFFPKVENCLYTQYWNQGVRLKYLLKLK